jgi:hypothetical protein
MPRASTHFLSFLWTASLSSSLIASEAIQRAASESILRISLVDFNTNCPCVGGFVEPVNRVTLISLWFGVIGLVGFIGTVVVVARKRQL